MNDSKGVQEALPPATHPYGVHIPILLGSNLNLLLREDDVSIPFAGDRVLRLVANRTPPGEAAHHQRRISLYLDAFTSATEAEWAGKLLTLSVLWVAAFKRVTIGFRRRTGDYPFAVRDRTIGGAISVEGGGYASYQIEPEELASIAEQAYMAGVDPPQHVLVSMEFFAASRLEATQRARFISLMTALEALSSQHEYGDAVATVLNELAHDLRSHPKLAGADNDRLRESLAGRILQLRRESVRQAIQRTVKASIQSTEDAKFIDEVYGLRSRILHEGHIGNTLHAESHRIEGILRRMYAAALGLDLPTLPTIEV